MRQILDNPTNYDRKKRLMAKLVDRYHMAKALLEEWEPFIELDRPYVAELRERVRGYENDIIYRGGEPK